MPETPTTSDLQGFLETLRAERSELRRDPGETEPVFGWKVINQRNIPEHIALWIRFLKYIDEHPRASYESIMRASGIENYPRGTMHARYIGLVDQNNVITPAGQAFYKSSGSEQAAVLENQLEKWFYSVDEFFHAADSNYRLYPYFFVLALLVNLAHEGKQTTLSQEELDYFVVTSKTYSDLDSRVKLISNFRTNSAQWNSKFSRVVTKTYLDRICFFLSLSSLITTIRNPTFSIALKQDRIQTVREKILKFEFLLRNGKLLAYGTNNEDYFKMLHSNKSFFDYHAEHFGIKLDAENIVINEISSYIASKGFVYENDAIASYYASLRAKPFVILSGITGSGKTKLTELFAEAISSDYPVQYLRVAVRPDWTSDRFLVGFYNPITEKYSWEPFLTFLIRASTDSSKPYFLCLDEMNLAHVEYYFSSFLSGFESDDRTITLHSFPIPGEVNVLKDDDLDALCAQFGVGGLSKRDEKISSVKEKLQSLPPGRVKIPSNLFFTGTVNVDETTHLFSPKVLDRANVMEFQRIRLNDRGQPISSPKLGFLVKEFAEQQFLRPLEKESYNPWLDKNWQKYVTDGLEKINAVLEPVNLHFGYRTRDEILRFLYHSRNIIDPKKAFDVQIKQKVLPKIKGHRSLEPTLKSLKTLLEGWQATESVGKLDQMISRLEDGYTSYF